MDFGLSLQFFNFPKKSLKAFPPSCSFFSPLKVGFELLDAFKRVGNLLHFLT